MQPTITIGIQCDGFSITYNGKRFDVNQEDDHEAKLKEIFEALGYHVEVEAEY